MNKGCHWILAILIIAEAIVHVPCRDLKKKEVWRTRHRRNTLFLQPLHNLIQNFPPIPIHFPPPSHYEEDDPPEFEREEQTPSPTFESPWTPIDASKGDESVNKEVYIASFGARNKGPIVMASPTQFITRRPNHKATFNIPLRKSIQVSRLKAGYRPFVQSLERGSLRNTENSNIREAEDLKESTQVNDWKPRSFTTPRPPNSESLPNAVFPNSRKPGQPPSNNNMWNPSGRQVQTSRDEQGRTQPIRLHFTTNDVKMSSVEIQKQNPNLLSNTQNKEVQDANGASDSTFFEQPIIRTQPIKKDSRKASEEAEIYRTIPGKIASKSVIPTNEYKDQVLTIAHVPVSIGVKYTELDLSKFQNFASPAGGLREVINQIPEQKPGTAPDIETSKPDAHGVITTSVNNLQQQDDITPLVNTPKQSITSISPMKQPGSVVPSIGTAKQPNFINPEHEGNINIKKGGDSNTEISKGHQNRLKITDLRESNYSKQQHFVNRTVNKYVHPAQPERETFRILARDKPAKQATGSISGTKDPSKLENIDLKSDRRPKSHSKEDPTLLRAKIPFYTDVKSKKKEQLKDIYFSTTYPRLDAPDSVHSQNHQKQQSISDSSDNSGNNLRSAMENRPHDISNTQNGKYRDIIRVKLRNSTTGNDFSSLILRKPTPPPLITVNYDSSGSEEGSTSTRFNRTGNFILQRKPSLQPEFPGSGKPRKPKIRITTGMLAGILVAAFVFLGFLTGTVVYAFHEWKFGRQGRGGRHGDRQTRSKGPTGYNPEYLEEAFAGNTYIHNHIFLPPPQNLEERAAVDHEGMPLSGDEGPPTPEQPTTSGIYPRGRRHRGGEAVD